MNFVCFRQKQSLRAAPYSLQTSSFIFPFHAPAQSINGTLSRLLQGYCGPQKILMTMYPHFNHCRQSIKLGSWMPMSEISI
ncbi:hypothetical protein QCA50_013568 [Cerrena zonata]|uniref:Uncharacterized protein n=1 Tax=Cerrena zonata TaxID=2478898 RepID=A0AAW0FR17_9APHY